MNKLRINYIYIFSISYDNFSFTIKGEKWEFSTGIFKSELFLSLIHILNHTSYILSEKWPYYIIVDVWIELCQLY